MDLRIYQQDSVAAVKQAFSKDKRKVILCIPTGGGKTVVFSHIAQGVIAKQKTVMIICDRKELITQAYQKISEYGLLPTIIAPGYPQYVNKCYLASLETLARRVKKADPPKVDLVIIDEAHKSSFDKIFDIYPNAFYIGATATPQRKGKQKSLDEFYDEIINPVSVAWLIENGFLAPARTFSNKVDTSNLQISGDDYNNEQMFGMFNKTVLYDGVIDNYRRFSPGKKAVCFNVNVEHSIAMCQQFNEAGISARHIDGDTPKQLRSSILEGFKRGNFQVLCNCSILTTGYDEPSIETVIVNRATLSLPLWLQMCGRGSRTHTGKTHFNIIDMGGNVYKHGLWQEEREWSLKKRKKVDGVAPVKDCPECGAMLHLSARICGQFKEDLSICEYEFPMAEEKEKELETAEFIEVTPESLAAKAQKPPAPKGLGRRFDPYGATDQQIKEFAASEGKDHKWIFVQKRIRDEHAQRVS